MGFRLTEQAEQDIIGIAEMGLRQFGPVQARCYHEELYAIFDLSLPILGWRVNVARFRRQSGFIRSRRN